MTKRLVSGALTLKFYSDYSATYSGFEANISCSTITGVDEVAASTNAVTIYPNPVTDLVNVNLGAVTENQKIELITVSGQVLNTQNLIPSGVSNTTATIDMHDFVNGIYFIRISAGNKITNTKIIKIQ